MSEASRAVIVTGTVVHLEARVVVVPTRPPAPTRLPRSEELRRSFLAENPGWVPDDPDVADAVRRENIAERLRSDSWAVVELHGTDLPADSVRAQVRGELTGRSVVVDSWELEPCSTSTWAAPRVEGIDAETAGAIADDVPEDWPVISTGISTTTAGRSAVMIEVDHLTPEMITWFDSQPPGSVQLDTFVDVTTRVAPRRQ
jgi:hypothetical protein